MNDTLDIINPTLVTDRFSKDVSNKITQAMSDVLYTPLLKASKVDDRLTISKEDDLIAKAIKQSKIVYSYSQGGFVGKFNASISRELTLMGAYYDLRTKSYKISLTALKPKYKDLINKRSETQQRQITEIKEFLNKPAQTVSLASVPLFANVVDYLESKTLLNLQQKNIDVKKSVVDSERFQSKYLDNVDMSIKEFTKTQNELIKREIQEMTLKGKQIKDIQQFVDKRYGVGKERARFIAKQNVSIITSEYQNERYMEAGITQFYWIHPDPYNKTSRDHHREWHSQSKRGQLFSTVSPPVNPVTGEPELPGIPFNCNCFPKYKV
jgi:hypothetical protein